MTNWRLFVFMTHDPALSAAVRPVGVLGLDSHENHVSWLPHEPGAGLWQERLTGSRIPLARAVRHWSADADGISSDIIEVKPPEAENLATAVEKTVDLLLAGAAEEEAS